MIEISGIEMLIPAIVTVLIMLARQFTARLDGPVAYYVSIVINILAQVLAELAGVGGGAGMAGAAAMGAGTGMIASPGLAITGKRFGLRKIVKPKRE
jgi:hypothetical protein